MNSVSEFISELLKNRLALFVVVLMCVFGVLAHHIAEADAAFSHAYLVYARLSDDSDQATYVPTAVNNSTRQEINLTLSLVLQGKMTTAERLEKAKHGLELQRLAKAEIDEMSPKIDAAEAAIADMEKSVSPADAIFQRGDPQKIIAAAKDRLQATKDIRALSGRANYETEQIFQHLVDTKGELSNSYVQDLNNLVPATQDEFDRRQQKYNDLQTDFDTIQGAYADFTSIFSTVKH